MNIAYQNRAACPPRSGFFPTFWSATSVSIRSLGSGSRRSKAPESQPFASESRASDRRPACRATAYGRRQGRFFGGRGRAIGTKSLIWPRHAPGCQIADILTESVTGAGNLTCDDVHSKAIAASSASRICRRRKATRCGGSRAELQSVCPTSSFGRGEDRKDVGKGMLAQARWDDTTKDAKLPDQINKMLDCSESSYVWVFGPHGVTCYPAGDCPKAYLLWYRLAFVVVIRRGSNSARTGSRLCQRRAQAVSD
jgi:hypothetical protein